MLLDYSSISPRRSSPQFPASAAILIASCLVYGIACVPAMRQGGYPPIDARLQGMTLLWIGGVPLSALFTRWSRRRLVELQIYAFATGFIDSASWPTMVPNHFDPLGCLVITVILFGPIHLAVAGALEGLWRFIARKTRPRLSLDASIRTRVLLAIVMLVASAGLPGVYSAFNSWRLTRAGRSLADKDWSAHSVQLFAPSLFSESPNGAEVETTVEAKTRLPTRHKFRHGFEDAYNQRISELIARNGIPPWAEPAIPTQDELAADLDADNLEEIKTFPIDITPGITLIRGGTVTKFGGIMSSGGSELAIASRHGITGLGDNPTNAVFVGRDPQFPKLVFIRSAHEWLGVFDDNGQQLVDVRRRE